MYTDNQSLRNLIQSNHVLIAAHRGTCGGNIIQNTSKAYENALLHGADMLEIDAAMTADGVFYAFHNGEEMLALGIQKDIRKMTSREVDSYCLLNSIQHKTTQKLERLEDVLERFRGRCLINIDRSWFYWREIIALLERMDMKEQIVLKSGVKEEWLKELEESGTGIMYMPIMGDPSEWDILEKYNINVAAAELIFKDLESGFLDEHFMGNLHAEGIAPWVNSITLDDGTVLSGLLDDDHAITHGFEGTWGRLIDMGFEIIQTDWPALLKRYLITSQMNEQGGEKHEKY